MDEGEELKDCRECIGDRLDKGCHGAGILLPQISMATESMEVLVELKGLNLISNPTKHEC